MPLLEIRTRFIVLEPVRMGLIRSAMISDGKTQGSGS